MLAALLLVIPTTPSAHEIPANVTVLAFVHPQGERLQFLVRVPLQAMRDMSFPQRGLGYLDVARATPLLHDAARVWIASYVELYEQGTRLGDEQIVSVRVSLPSDRSLGTWEQALAHVTGPSLSEEVDLPWQQAMLDVLFEYSITSDQARFSIRSGLAHLGLRTLTVLRYVTPSGTERVYQFTGDPGLVRLDPQWYQAAFRFVQLGFLHILDGLDHLLFVLCLVIPFRRLRPLVVIVTSFTVAHSITLIASAVGLAPRALWFQPLIETLIALSIVFMAFENIAGARLERRWLFAFGFGLVHGFGFSFFLRDSLQFAGSHLAASLLSFNLGVELGQLLVVALAVPVLDWMFRHAVAERIGTVVLSALVAHSAWHWMTERGSTLRAYQYQWPAWDAALVATLMRGLMLILILVAVVWGLLHVFGRWLSAGGDREPAAGAGGA